MRFPGYLCLDPYADLRRSVIQDEDRDRDIKTRMETDEERDNRRV